MKRLNESVAGFLAVVAVLGAGAAYAADWGPYQVENRRSGFTYMTDETRAMQEDNFQNPGMLWVEDGADLWNKVDGEAGKACSSCHQDAAVSMKGVAPRFPLYDAKLGKLKSIEQQINMCRENNMKAKPFKWESRDMLAMTTYVTHQSLGMPVNVKVDGDAAPFFEKGKKFYFKRRGQLDLACKNCHEDYPGGQLRANILSEGQANGFPTYRLKWQKIGSLQRRFRGCNDMVRAEPYPYGDDNYVNLELYVKWRGRGLPIETPAVRN